jgi:hypothetical protein
VSDETKRIGEHAQALQDIQNALEVTKYFKEIAVKDLCHALDRTEGAEKENSVLRADLASAIAAKADAESHAKRLEEYMLKGVAFRDELQARIDRLEKVLLRCKMWFVPGEASPGIISEIDAALREGT